MKVYNPIINNIEESAFSTPTGKIANKLGYKKIDLLKSKVIAPSNNEVRLFFINPDK